MKMVETAEETIETSKVVVIIIIMISISIINAAQRSYGEKLRTQTSVSRRR